MNAAGTHSHKRSDRMLAMLALLQENGQMSLSSLATELGTSEATIRRDVAVLASQGLLDRTHGGARPIQGSRELPVRLRDGRNQAAKSRIAAAAAKLVPEGKHAIGLSGGTTAAEVLRALHHRTDLTIITNSLSIGLEAAEQGQGRVLIAGGVLRSNSLELVGSLAEATLRLVNVGTALVGVDGLSSSGGLTTHDDIEARTNHDDRTGTTGDRCSRCLQDRARYPGKDGRSKRDRYSRHRLQRPGRGAGSHPRVGRRSGSRPSSR